ncbi:MAG: alpha/beta fold hydrolase [Arcicella sp.]|jgi:esterase/lipase|nr:alpha/beta fold hydrolase [Arcicella sp.]
MKTFLKTILAIIGIGTVGYFLGPKPEAPKLDVPMFKLSGDLPTLEKQINEGEATEKGIRPDCQARIVWADSAKKERTKLAILYIHGFSATQEEGNPVHRNLAKKYGANLYLARLAGHGIDLGDSTMATVTADDFVISAEKALAIAKTLGDEVVVVATSFGGALTTYLASQHPEIKAIVVYSPCIKIYDDNAELLDNPWGLELGKAVSGSYVRDFPPANPEHAKYWCRHYHLNGVIALQNFLTNVMKPETFAKVKCPAFIGYYYKNEEEQDKVVSVPAMLKMFEELGSANKQKVAFPNAGNHVLASPILSKDVATVQAETEKFLDGVLIKK